MKSGRAVKNLRTYINIDNDTNSEFNERIITVEHRSNNPKRDYLFVNKLQCKHIPCSPTDMFYMCTELAYKVNKGLIHSIDKSAKVLVIGFAETATAIANVVADRLMFDTYVKHTTREEVAGSKEMITFEEEHSHATTQKLLTYDFTVTADFMKSCDYVLFVEDEISTGNTIVNFIKAFKKAGLNNNKDIRFGVASICNWQNSENRKLYKDMGIDTYCLIRGELKDVQAKMLVDTDIQLMRDTKVAKGLTGIKTYDFQLGNVFNQERLGYNRNSNYKNTEVFKDTVDKIVELASGAESIRIIGTEEFMETPIRIGMILESLGKTVLCHSTTRSKIDVLQTKFDGESDGIKDRYQVISAYDSDRCTYIYNTNEAVDLTIIISDTPNIDQFEKMVGSVAGAVNHSSLNVIGIRV